MAVSVTGCQAALDEECRSLCDNVSARAVGGREMSWMCIPVNDTDSAAKALAMFGIQGNETDSEAAEMEKALAAAETALAMFEDDLDHEKPPRGFCKGRGLVPQARLGSLWTTKQSKKLHKILRKPICPQSKGWHPYVRSWTNTRSRRLAWVHIPKAGVSFGTTLVHYANSSLRHTVIASGPRGCEPCLQKFFELFPEHVWFRDGTLWQPWRSVFDHATAATSLRPTHRGYGGFGDHWPITVTGLMQAGGHLVGLFREPFSRAKSAYLFFCKQLLSERCVLSFEEYSRRLVGSVTKMLSGQAHGLECNSLKDSTKHGEPGSSNRTREIAYMRCRHDVRPDLPTALRRIDAFAFVGLTDDYDRSICLFHAMFPSPCLAVEFKNVHPSKYRETDMRGTSANLSLSAYAHDPYDSELWLAACERYKADLHRYEVTAEKCEQLCPTAPAGVFMRAPFQCQLPGGHGPRQSDGTAQQSRAAEPGAPEAPEAPEAGGGAALASALSQILQAVEASAAAAASRADELQKLLEANTAQAATTASLLLEVTKRRAAIDK